MDHVFIGERNDHLYTHGPKTDAVVDLGGGEAIGAIMD